MDLAQLRYPVVSWTGRTPLHQIRTLAIAFPQTSANAVVQNASATIAAASKQDEESKSNGSQTRLQSPAPVDRSASPHICSSTHPPHAVLMTGSETGELAHWYINSYRTEGKERKQCGSNSAIPRALLLRQGSTCCTALTYCRSGTTQMFCAGTSEGFLTLWSINGGRCIKSELVLPFAPNQILFYQRYNPLAHGRSARNVAPNSSPSTSAASSLSVASPPLYSGASSVASSTTSVRRAMMHNYLLCSSIDHREIYVIELPSLALLAILCHRAPVLHMSLIPPTASKSRIPYLITVTGQHHICMWDLSKIERKPPTHTSSKSQFQQPTQQSQPHKMRANSSSEFLQSLTSSITTGPPTSTAASNSSPAMTSQVLKFDEPAQTFLVPLPPMSFTLSPLFVPVSLALSPCGTLVILVFPYAFMCVRMYTFESEGEVHSMASDLSQDDVNECINRHAPWSGAGFLSAPTTTAVSSSDSPAVQYLVLWNASGEFVWIYSITPTGEITRTAATSSSSISNGKPKDDNLSLPMTPLKRSSSTSKFASPRSAINTAQLAGASNGSSFEAPELGTPTSATHTPPPTVMLVAKCSMGVRGLSSVTNGTISTQPAASLAPPSLALTAVHLSGHTIYGGTEEGAIYQWHIPICQAPLHLNAHHMPHIFHPTHISRLADAFVPLPSTEDQDATSPRASPPMSPTLLRGATMPVLAISPSRIPSPPASLDDLPSASTMLIDPGHEALLLATGHTSGAIKVQNVLSRASTHLELQVRHEGMVTCMMHVSGPQDTCMLVSGGVDGIIHMIEMGTGSLYLTLKCYAPILSLHKPSSVDTLIFADCADASLRAFTLTDGSQVFAARGLDSPVKAVFRPQWAIASDALLIQTRLGTLYIFSIATSQLIQTIDLDSGAPTFLQKYDLISPASQLAIVAHRLYQFKHLKKKPLPPLNASQQSTPSSVPSAIPPSSSFPSMSSTSGSASTSTVTRSSSGMSLKLNGENLNEDGGDIFFSNGTSASVSVGPPSSNLKPLPPGTAYEPPRQFVPPLLSRAVSSMSRSTPQLLRRPSVATGVDAAFHKAIYRMNQAHQQQEREKKVGGGSAHVHAPHPTALNPLNPPVHGPLARAHLAPPPSHIANTIASAPLQSLYKRTPSPPPSVPTMTPTSSPSAVPPTKSPITCVDVVSSPLSSCSPLQHLHANVYVWNVHQLLPFLAGHVSMLVSMAKRRAIILASRADPTNVALQAQANQARATTIPPSFYVLCGLLSTLFDWSAMPAPIEKMLKNEMRCYIPTPVASFASLSDNSQSLTLLLPNHSRDQHRWSFDTDLSSRHMLAVTSVLTHMLKKSEPQSAASNWFQSALQYYTFTLPRTLMLFTEPDIHVLAWFALNIHQSIHMSARQLVHQCLERTSAAERRALSEEQARFFEYTLPQQRLLFQPEFSLTPADLVASGSIMAVCENGPGIGYVFDEEMVHTILLTWVGLFEMRQQRRQSISVNIIPAPQDPSYNEFHAKSAHITNTLIRMIAWPVATEHEIIKCVLACELLSRGLLIFRHHITEPLLLLRRLYTLSHHSHEFLARTAMSTLLDAGKIAPTHFVACLSKEAMNQRGTNASRHGALACVNELIKRYPLALSRALPFTVRQIVATLDPAEQALRKSLLQSSTSVLYALAAQYPQISFHQTSQHYAVGTITSAQTPATIIIYDLRTAAKFRVFEGHTSDIHAIAFHPKGQFLASYSATEKAPTLRIWNTGSSGFLSGLLGMESKCMYTWTMQPCVKKAPQQQVSSKTAMVSQTRASPSQPLANSDDEEEIVDVDEPVDEDDDDEPQTLAPRRPSFASPIHANPFVSARFTTEELLTVRIMWITEKALKLKREDGSSIEFAMV